MEIRPGTLYRVTVTEYDSGVQRKDSNDTKYFTTLEEAKAYQAHWEKGGNYECFWRCEVEQVS